MIHPVFIEDFQRIIAASEPRLRKLDGSCVLITGACGFIGSYFVDLLAYCNDNLFKKPCMIYGVDNNIVGDYGRLSHLSGRPEVKIINWDISRRFTTSGILMGWPIEYFIHCASIASPAVYRDRPLETMEVNSLGVWNMLDWAQARKAKAVLQFSSSEVYAEPDVIPTPESYVGRIPSLSPRAAYDVSKLFGETLCYNYREKHGVQVKIVRPHNIMGPGHPDDGRIIPSLLRAVVQGEDFVVHGDGSASRSYCYISDAVVQLLAVLIDGDFGPFNIGNDSLDGEASVNKVVTTAQKVFNGRPKVKRDDRVILTKDAPTKRRPDLAKVYALQTVWEFIGLGESLRRTAQTMVK